MCEWFMKTFAAILIIMSEGSVRVNVSHQGMSYRYSYRALVDEISYATTFLSNDNLKRM